MKPWHTASAVAVREAGATCVFASARSLAGEIRATAEPNAVAAAGRTAAVATATTACAAAYGPVCYAAAGMALAGLFAC